MNKRSILSAFIIASGALLLSNCASLSGLQDGRTVGKNNAEIGISMNFSQSPDFNKWEDQVDSQNLIPRQYFGNFEFGARYGVAEKLDVTLRLNTALNMGLGVKTQVVGDRESQFALALGAEVGTFTFISGLWNVQIPVYLSVHPTDQLTWYLTPRYIYQFLSFAGANNGLSYVGGNTGFLFGKRHKFGIDIGYYSIGHSSYRIGAVQFGLGGKFVIGGN